MSAADNGAAMRAAFDEYADQVGFKHGPDEDTGRGPAWRAWQEATRRASAREAALQVLLDSYRTLNEAGATITYDESGTWTIKSGTQPVSVSFVFSSNPK